MIRLRISEDMYAVLELCLDDGSIICTVPIGFLSPGSDYEVTGMDIEEATNAA